MWNKQKIWIKRKHLCYKIEREIKTIWLYYMSQQVINKHKQLQRNQIIKTSSIWKQEWEEARDITSWAHHERSCEVVSGGKKWKFLARGGSLEALVTWKPPITPLERKEESEDVMDTSGCWWEILALNIDYY